MIVAVLGSMTGVGGAASASTAYPQSCVADTYGRMFPGLASASWSDEALNSLAGQLIAPPESGPTPDSEKDAEDNTAIDAGYTYLGQFIDHDIAREEHDDDLSTPLNPSSMPNHRTAALDLDSLYGGGPSASPQLYATDKVHLRVGNLLSGAANDPGARDLPRDSSGQALVGDDRNDENRVVGGIHSIMLRFHNKLADKVRAWHPF